MSRVQIYTSAFCGYCTAAKKLLELKGFEYEEVRVDLDPAGREEMQRRARRTSVPQIFIDDEHVGGFDDLRALALKGGLDPAREGGAGSTGASSGEPRA